MTEINEDDIFQAESLLLSFVSERFPEINVSVGSAFRSHHIEPAAAIYALIRKEIQTLKQSLSLENIAESDFDESIQEAFISNFLVNRKQGTPAKGTLKIKVGERKDYSVNDKLRFEYSGVTFAPDSTGLYGASQDDRPIFLATDGYFFLLPVTATTSDEVTVEQGTQFFISQGSFLDTSFIEAVSFSDFSSASGKETITEFRDRAKASLTSRTLSSRKGIKSALEEEFSEILDVQVAGYGDPEQIRDISPAAGIHVGGCVDIFVRTSDLPNTFTLERRVITNSEVVLEYPIAPVLRVKEVYLKEGDTLTLLEEGVDYSVVFGTTETVSTGYEASYSRFSKLERVKIKALDSSLVDKTLTIVCDRSEGLQAINDYLDDEDNRPVSNSLLAKTQVPAYISMELSIRYSNRVGVPNSSTIKTLVSDHINSLRFPSKPQVSEIIKSIYSEVPEALGVSLPLTLSADIYYPNGTSETLTSTDLLEIPANTEIGFSSKVVQYICYPSSVTVNLVSDS